MNESQIFPLIGEEGFTRLVSAFYRQVFEDDIIGPMYPKEDREGSERRLRDFLIYRFGGPQRYMVYRRTRASAAAGSAQSVSRRPGGARSVDAAHGQRSLRGEAA
jgi:truncated hemoglobin YjbI